MGSGVKLVFGSVGCTAGLPCSWLGLTQVMVCVCGSDCVRWLAGVCKCLSTYNKCIGDLRCPKTVLDTIIKACDTAGCSAGQCATRR